MASATKIDGKAAAALVRAEVKAEVESAGINPCLAVVLVGERPDSATYVATKEKACEECGIKSIKVTFPSSISESALIAAVEKLNSEDKVDGILVQLPLPEHCDEAKVLHTISSDKDVDGLHPVNMGKLALRGVASPLVACTPQGCIYLLESVLGKDGIAGKDAVIIGRSNIVGVPMSLLLLERSATVTIAHSRTKNLAEVTKRADILVAAVGKANFVKGDWVKPGAVVIDVGINAVDDASRKRGYRLVGDVDASEIENVASAYTPVPGGVGPMTVAMLMKNTLTAARMRKENSKGVERKPRGNRRCEIM